MGNVVGGVQKATTFIIQRKPMACDLDNIIESAFTSSPLSVLVVETREREIQHSAVRQVRHVRLPPVIRKLVPALAAPLEGPCDSIRVKYRYP